MNRLRAGTAAVRNPLNRARVSVLEFDPAGVDGIVFWTKNPAPFLPRLDEIDGLGYTYYFQFTITPYGADLEPGLDKAGVVQTFRSLSARLGRERVVWRYDPVLLSAAYTPAFHRAAFAALAERLAPYTETCVISFVDRYAFLDGSFRSHGIAAPGEEEMRGLAEAFAQAAASRGLRLASCSERIDLAQYGIARSKCVDAALIARISGRDVRYKKDPSQRPACGCAASRDIGAYNTCAHRCLYCYARRGPSAILPPACDPDSPVLCGRLESGDKVTRCRLQGAIRRVDREGEPLYTGEDRRRGLPRQLQLPYLQARLFGGMPE